MAGIVSATPAQILAARDKVLTLAQTLQQIAHNVPQGPALPAAMVTLVDAQVDAAVAAIAPLNT